MSLVDIEAKAAVWTAKHVAYVLAGVLGLLLVAALYYAVVIRPAELSAAADAAKANAALAGAGQRSGADAVGIVNDNAHSSQGITDKARVNHDTILRAPGAQAPVDDGVDAAGRGALCMFSEYADDPYCKRLRQPGP